MISKISTFLAMGDYDSVANLLTFLAVVGIGTITVTAVATLPAWGPPVATYLVFSSAKNLIFPKKGRSM